MTIIFIFILTLNQSHVIIITKSNYGEAYGMYKPASKNARRDV